LSGRPSSAVHTTAPLSPWQPNVTTCSRLTTGQTRRKQTVAWASSGGAPECPFNQIARGSLGSVGSPGLGSSATRKHRPSAGRNSPR
jgi:hypothetical protein